MVATAEAEAKEPADEDFLGGKPPPPPRDLLDPPPAEDGLRTTVTSEACLCHSSTVSGWWSVRSSSSLFSNPEAGGIGELNAGGGVAVL